MSRLRVNDPGAAYREASNLSLIWKKELEKVDGEIFKLEKELSISISNINYINNKKTNLIKQRDTILSRAKEQELF